MIAFIKLLRSRARTGGQDKYNNFKDFVGGFGQFPGLCGCQKSELVYTNSFLQAWSRNAKICSRFLFTNREWMRGSKIHPGDR